MTALPGVAGSPGGCRVRRLGKGAKGFARVGRVERDEIGHTQRPADQGSARAWSVTGCPSWPTGTWTRSDRSMPCSVARVKAVTTPASAHRRRACPWRAVPCSWSGPGASPAAADPRGAGAPDRGAHGAVDEVWVDDVTGCLGAYPDHAVSVCSTAPLLACRKVVTCGSPDAEINVGADGESRRAKRPTHRV